jgi:ABC-type Zn uptake system ZnuABC Zn-binding protein ZnuA
VAEAEGGGDEVIAIVGRMGAGLIRHCVHTRRPARPATPLRVAAFLLTVSLLPAASGALAQERLAVVTSTTDLKALVEAVGGERVAVTTIAPATMDAEDYQPKPQDVARVKGARLVVRVGLDYDLWFDRLLAQAGRAELMRGQAGYVDASYAIAVLEVRGAAVGPGDGHAHGNGNPHYWLDPKNAEIITATILEALGRLDPDCAQEFERNRQTFLLTLAGRISEWERRMTVLQGRALVAYHNSWAYFARRFRLDIAGFIEPKPGVQPSPAHLAAMIRSMREKNVAIVIREPYEPERDVAFLAAKSGASVAVLAASVGATPQARDYVALFDADVDTLVAQVAR